MAAVAAVVAVAAMVAVAAVAAVATVEEVITIYSNLPFMIKSECTDLTLFKDCISSSVFLTFCIFVFVALAFQIVWTKRVPVLSGLTADTARVYTNSS